MGDNREKTLINGHATLKDRVRELRLDDQLSGAKQGNSTSGWLPWALCFVLAVSWAFVGIRWYRGQEIRAAGPAAGVEQGAPVADNVAKKDGPNNNAPDQIPVSGELVLEKKGYIIPAHQIPISPIDVAGRIIELNFVEGDERPKGFVLAKIDPTSFQADLEEAKAQVAACQARFAELDEGWQHEVQQTESDLGEARAQMIEAQFVYDTSKATSANAVAKLEVNQNKKKLDALVQRVKSLEAKLAIAQGPRKLKTDAAKQDLEAAKARFVRSQWRLDNCSIKAPVTGIILTKKAENGSLINPVVGGVSTSLCEMADLTDIEIDLEVDERDVAKVFVDQACTIRVDAYPDRKYQGYVSRMMPIGNRGKAVLPIRVKVIIEKTEKQGRFLKPEMNALVSFFNKISTDAPKRDVVAKAPANEPTKKPDVVVQPKDMK